MNKEPNPEIDNSIEILSRIRQIDLELIEITPYLKRRDDTHRVCEESGMDALLDERNDLTRDFDEPL